MALGLSILMIIFVAIVGLAVPVAVGAYVYNDAKRRNMSALLWTLIAVLAPGFIGFIIFLIIRNDYSGMHCPRCGKSVASHFSVCPGCGFSLNNSCPVCNSPLSYDWNICPHCASEVPEDMRIEKKAKVKADKGFRRLMAIVIIIPVVLGLLLIATVVYVFSFNNNAEIINTTQSVVIQQENCEGTVEIELGDNNTIVTDITAMVYSDNDDMTYMSGVSVDDTDSEIFDRTVSMELVVPEIKEGHYLVVTAYDAYDSILAFSVPVSLDEYADDSSFSISLVMEDDVIMKK